LAEVVEGDRQVQARAEAGVVVADLMKEHLMFLSGQFILL
jgi:hypothetical protein